VGFPAEALGEGLAGGGYRRTVDVGAALGRDQQNYVGVAGPEAVPEQVGGSGRLGPRVAEPPGREVGGHPTADHAGEDEPGQGQQEDEPATADDRVGQTGEHYILL
jgi:hypothetical protein